MKTAWIWSFCSTVSALSTCTDHWFVNIDNGQMSSTILLDIQESFDIVDHKILLINFLVMAFVKKNSTFSVLNWIHASSVAMSMGLDQPLNK